MKKSADFAVDTQAAPDTGAVRGCIDGVYPHGVVDGWCAGPPGGNTPRQVMIRVDGKLAAQGVPCKIFREDLCAAGVGDGYHGFKAELPLALREPGREAIVEVVDQQSGVQLGTAVHVVWAAPTAGTGLEGHIDSISDEGMMLGWCWDRADPARRVALNVLADGVRVGTTVAGLYRDDLRVAGKADGHCGFSFFLPWTAISARSEVNVALQDIDTGLLVGLRATLRRPQIVNAEQRIETLERQLQLLCAELKTAETRAEHVENQRQVPDLFKTVAAFFEDLANGTPRARLVNLRIRLDEVADRLPLVTLVVPDSADTTILVLPDGQVDHLHACLAALHRAGVDQAAHVAVLDTGDGDGEDLALIHAAVRHVAISRLRPNETINDVLRGLPTAFIGLLPCHVGIGPDWLRQAHGLFRKDKRVGLVAARFAGTSGEAFSAGLVADPVHGLQASPLSADADDIDAVDELCLCLRADMLWELGGLNLSYAGWPGQILDLCLRARRAGWRLASHEKVVGRLTEATASLLDRITAEEAGRLRAACALNKVANLQRSRETVARAARRSRKELLRK